MTEATFRRVVDTWQKRLGLAQYRLTLKFEDEDKDRTDATTDCSIYDDATITFFGAKDWDRRKVNEVVVHELLHVLHYPIDLAVEALGGHLQRDVRDISSTAYDNACEVFIDRQARLIVALGGKA